MTGDRLRHEIVYSEETIRNRVRELGREVSAAYSEEDRLVVIGVLKGSFLFLADLVRAIEVPHEIDFLIASSYGDAMVSSGQVEFRCDPRTDVKDRAVLLVEDVFDTGRTGSKRVPRIESLGASSGDVISLLHKRVSVELLEPRWVGFDAPESFLVGYGLDHAEAFRHLPYIASI